MNEWFRKQVEQDVACGRQSRGWRRGGRSFGTDQDGCSHYMALMTVRRDLHDQVGSTLAGMEMQLELACRLIGMDASRARDVLWELRADVAELMAGVRRIGDGQAVDRGVVDMEAALRSMMDRLNRLTAPRREFSLEFDPAVGAVRDEAGAAAFWIVREAVMNVLKHSPARHCQVSLQVLDEELRVRVEDDGSRSQLPPSGGSRSGLANMSARAAEMGGWCTAAPLKPMGFAVVACLPLTAARG